MSTLAPLSVQLQLQMRGIELLKVQINPPAPGFNPVEFQFNLNLETKLDAANKLAFIITSADVKADNKPDLLGVVSTVTIFSIPNFDDVFSKKDESLYQTPDEIMFVLISIAISTLRGVMFEKFRGTHLHKAILPVIDPKTFKKDT